jgi:hypothetical protein
MAATSHVSPLYLLSESVSNGSSYQHGSQYEILERGHQLQLHPNVVKDVGGRNTHHLLKGSVPRVRYASAIDAEPALAYSDRGVRA